MKNITTSKRERLLAETGLACLFLLLLGQVLIYPPYEGFDETAHYSYISYLADEGDIPWIGVTRFDSTLAGDLHQLPRPYSTVPPLENNGGLTYRSFHEQPDSVKESSSRRFWSPRSQPARFIEDDTTAINGAASHPPLYYTLMVLPYRLSKSWSPGASLLLMRLLSICLASASYWMFWRSVQLLDDPELRLRLLGGGLVALHSASIVFEFGRLGNDSLVVLLFSAIFYLLLRLARNGMEGTRDFALLGFVLGLGLMTKLYFVASLTVAMLAIGYLGYSKRVPLRPLLGRMGLLAAVALLTGGWWYVLFKSRYGVFFGTHVTLTYSPATTEIGITDFLYGSARMFASAFSTFIWSGSWSFLRRTPTEYLLCAPFFVLVTAAVLRGLRQHSAEERLVHIAAAVLLVPMVGGTALYILDAVLHGVNASLGGYYWLVAWPALAVLYAALFKRGSTRRALPVALVFMLIFELIGWWKQLLLYSGLLAKHGAVKTGTGFVYPGVETVSTVVEHLSLLSWPLLALPVIAVALILRTGALLVQLAPLRQDRTASSAAMPVSPAP